MLQYFMYAVFYSVWVGSLICFYLSLVAIVLTDLRYYLLPFFAIYYSYRYFISPLKKWPAAQQFGYRMFKKYQYFPVQKVVFEDDAAPPAPDSKALLAYHPHGVLSCGWTSNGIGSESFANSKVEWLVSDVLFNLPVMGDMISWAGCGPAGKENFEKLCSKKHNIALIPGGYEEATHFKHGQHQVYLKKRKGFIKLALKYGYKVYPVYTFGEELAYTTINSFLRFRLWLNSWKIPGVVFYGKWWCSVLPYDNNPLVTVVGKPLELPLIEHPTWEQVEKHHDEYMKQLEALFDKHKAQYAKDPKATLHFL
ncbi:diacylglycerol acyltransferase [Thraustotheca clavata]|uniref:Acyltransferase n=1 Tax=Thraustotheca clavata TaxID=74557 RepID=A0A1V9ZWB6_9STRA|nr:diacylglycerol acyltransferase [Thraustotheca clavata]